METRFDDKDEAEKYKAAHRFDIAGESLTAEEIDEQKRNLINKIFTFGYMLHQYKSPSRAWAPMAMDNKSAKTKKAMAVVENLSFQDAILSFKDCETVRQECKING